MSASYPSHHESRPNAAIRRGSAHLLPCPMCHQTFDLFAATWCAHFDRDPSKVCPHCQSCSCEHPAYGEPGFWREAPEAFRDNGFERLFLLYL